MTARAWTEDDLDIGGPGRALVDQWKARALEAEKQLEALSKALDSAIASLRIHGGIAEARQIQELLDGMAGSPAPDASLTTEILLACPLKPASPDRKA